MKSNVEVTTPGSTFHFPPSRFFRSKSLPVIWVRNSFRWHLPSLLPHLFLRTSTAAEMWGTLMLGTNGNDMCAALMVCC